MGMWNVLVRMQYAFRFLYIMRKKRKVVENRMQQCCESNSVPDGEQYCSALFYLFRQTLAKRYCSMLLIARNNVAATTWLHPVYVVELTSLYFIYTRCAIVHR